MLVPRETATREAEVAMVISTRSDRTDRCHAQGFQLPLVSHSVTTCITLPDSVRGLLGRSAMKLRQRD